MLLMINVSMTILSRLMFFYKHFSSIFTTDDGQLPKIDPRTDKPAFLSTIDFSVQNVHKILRSLKPTLSSGPDDIPNIVLRKLAHCISVTLAYIFQASFTTHCLPNNWLQLLLHLSLKKAPHLIPIITDLSHLHVLAVVSWKELSTVN